MQSEFPETLWLAFQGRRLSYYKFTPTDRSMPGAGIVGTPTPASETTALRPPILWFHANGYPALTYAPLLRSIAAAGYTVYALDFIGHGNSEVLNNFHDWFFFRDQALALLNHLQAECVRLIGHSFGGAAALLATAALQRDRAARTRIESLCLLDPTVLTPATVWLLRMLPNHMARAAEQRRHIFRSLRVVARSYRMHPGFKDWRQDVFDAYLRSALRARDDGQYELRLPPKVEARIFQTLKPGHWKHHRQVKCPVLVLQAAASTVCPNRAQKILTANHPASRGLSHPTGSHFFPMEFPDWTTDRILEFIAEN